MNIQDFKFVVASGCSYGTTISSLENKLLNVKLDTSDKIIFMEVSCASQSSDWIYDSTIYTIKKLLGLGVKHENIYCFVEWTQIERVTITQPTILHEFFNTNYAREKGNKHFYIHSNIDDSNIKNYLYDLMDIKSLEGVHNIMSIEKLWYLTPTHTDKNDVLKFDNVDFEVSYQQMIEYELRVPIETRVKKYLDNILNLQSYLKLLGIKYNFVSMQSQFSAWDIDNDYNHIHKYTIANNKPVIFYNNKLLQVNYDFKTNLNITDADDLINVFPQFKHLINQIDFSNWWFYNSDSFRYGGFDEYAIETYGLYGFLNTGYNIRNNDEIDISNLLPTFGYHPHAFIHVLLTNDMMFNNPFFKVSTESIDRIKTMVSEDIESKNRTKHNLTISKLELEKYISVF